MIKQIAVFLITNIVFFSFGRAYGGILDDLQNKAKGAVADTVGQAVSGAMNKTNKGGQASNDESKLGYVDLNTGMFGIPFGVNLGEVLKWCEENKVIITNETKQSIEEKARYTLGKIKDINKAYNTDKEQLSEMEKEVLKLTLDKDMGTIEKLGVLQAQKLLEDLKNPSFDYKGQNFLLNREFKDGEGITVNGIEKVCSDKRITNMIYSLGIAPSGSSERLSNNNLGGINIYFKKDDSGNLVSYATVAMFQDASNEILAKQYNSVLKVLTEKYGSPVYREQLWFKRSDIHGPPTGQGVTYSTSEEGTPEWIIYHLTGLYLSGDALLWKKNIILVTKFRNNDLSAPDAFEKNFYVIYYESSIANNLLDSYKQTIKDFMRTCSEEDIKKETQMKDNF